MSRNRPRRKAGGTAQEPGFDGMKVMTSTVRLSSARTERRSVRARPGTFEWRYGRKSADAALYHAGCHFADLWERAGTAAAKSRDLTIVGTPGWRGLPEGRAAALDEVVTLSIRSWPRDDLVREVEHIVGSFEIITGRNPRATGGGQTMV